MIDDDEALRTTLRVVLEMEDYEIRNAANGAEAFRELARGVPPELILLDLMMPVMNGYEFLERLRKLPGLAARIPVLVMTAADVRLLDMPKLRRAQGIIMKPFQVEYLLSQVRKQLNQQPLSASP